MREPLLTALVSTYAAERFLRGCLDDLLAQTLGDRLEILVIDACSPEAEGDIVREYQARGHAIRYVRAERRLNTSAAFNLGIGLARGRYLTTANTDDRHHPEFGARMCAVLEQHPEFALAYADTRITTHENETWAANSATLRHAWPDYSHTAALSCCLFGAQAVWRRAVHGAVGDFDPAIVRANDQDMFLRIALHGGAVHVRADLGLFLRRSDSESGVVNNEATLREVLAVMRRYRTTTPLEVLFPRLRDHAGDPLARAAALVELGSVCARGPYTDAEQALAFYQQALAVGGPALQQVYANNAGAVLACAGAPEQARRALALAAPLPEAAENLRVVDRAVRDGAPPRLMAMAFAELPHAVLADSRAVRAIEFDDAGGAQWTGVREQLPWDVFEGPNGVPIAAVDAAGPVAPAAGEHVLVVMYGWADSGGGTMLPRAFAKELAARGHRVSVVYAAAKAVPELPAYGVRRHRENGVDLFGLCNRPAAFFDLSRPDREIDDARLRALFAGLLDELRPDVVHVWNLHGLGLSLPGECRRRGIPTVLSTNNYWAICPRLYLVSERVERCEGPSADGSKCRACLGTAAPAADYAARTAAGARMLRGDFDVHLAVSARVRDLHVQNGDDPAHVRVLRQEPPQVGAIWERVGRDRPIVDRLDRALRVGFLGSVLPHKGVHVLAEALAMLPAGAVLGVAHGDVEPAYGAFLASRCPAERLRLLGRYLPERLPELLAELDVVVVPSVWDDCAPFVVAEALAARCPVVGADIGGIPDFVTPGVTGYLTAPGDARALADALWSFVDRPTRLGAMQRAIAAPRGLSAFVDDVLGVYAEVRGFVATAAP